jgi:hypothetical protein
MASSTAPKPQPREKLSALLWGSRFDALRNPSIPRTGAWAHPTRSKPGGLVDACAVR